MSRTKSLAIGGVVVAIAAGAVIIGSRDIMQRARAMMPAATSAAEFEASATGSREKLVVQIDSVAACGMISAHLLAKESDTLYRETATRLSAELPSDAFFIMGSAADIRKGTVLQLDGTIEPDRSLGVKQLVVLNGYVRVTR